MIFKQVINKVPPVALAALVLATSGCVQVRRPDGSIAPMSEVTEIKQQCALEAYRQFPPAYDTYEMRVQEAQREYREICRGVENNWGYNQKYAYDRSQVYGPEPRDKKCQYEYVNVPPQWVRVNVGEEQRQAYTRQCVQSKGYQYELKSPFSALPPDVMKKLAAGPRRRRRRPMRRMGNSCIGLVDRLILCF